MKLVSQYVFTPINSKVDSLSYIVINDTATNTIKAMMY
jgi:hypothetical protein